MKVTTYEFTSIDVVKERSRKRDIPKKLFVFTMGLFGMLSYLLSCLTIIGAFLAFPLGVMSFVMLQAFRGIQFVECPNCEKKNPVFKSDEDFKCTRCKIPVILNWK